MAVSDPPILQREDELLPLSALQHIVFCERQCALIHVEQVWKDNALTLTGSHMHARVNEDAPRRELRGDLLISRRVALRSFELGVSGIADVVEFHRAVSGDEAQGTVDLPGLAGRWRALPVEYKRGRPKGSACDEVQLCAQAICLEEMLGLRIPEGALFYGVTKHRHAVILDPVLRTATREAATRLHALFRSGETPRARREPKCRRCSLLELCCPDAMGPRRSARRFLAEAFTAVREDDAP
jgi:CRISPR-associated exonuclease Cas4